MPTVHWRYAEVPGLAVLSMCPDRETKKFIETVWMRERTPSVGFPDLFGREAGFQETVILCRLSNDGTYDSMQQALTADRLRVATQPLRPEPVPQLRTTLTRNRLHILELGDASVTSSGLDATLDCYNLNWTAPGGPGGPQPVTIIASSFGYDALNRTRFWSRRPEYPPWAARGLDGIRGWVFFRSSTGDTMLRWPGDTADETDAIFRNPKKNPPQYIPLDVLFRLDPALIHGSDGQLFRRWSIESRLFVLWGMFADKGRYAPALKQFIAFTASHPASEEKFREYFGFGYAEMYPKLTDWLERLNKHDAVPHLDPKVPASAISLRDATDPEVARITADFERRQAAGLKAREPERAGAYAEVARRTIGRGFKKAPDDAELLAIRGLLEADFGAPEEARSSLEVAFKAGARKPVSYFLLLAALRYREAATEAKARDGKLNSEQIAAIQEPLKIARTQPPVSAKVYGMMVALWDQTDAIPSAGDLAVLDEGARLFPFELPLIDATARVFVKAGRTEDAKRLVAHRLECARDDEQRRALGRLSTSFAPK